MVAVPAFLAVISPLWLTEATDVLLEDHLSDCEAVPGFALAEIFDELPTTRVMDLALTEMLFGRIGSVTVTFTDALTDETCAERAVIVAVPCFLAVITPLELTEATALLLDDHFTVLFAEAGATDAVTFLV
jgi:hypothetical protein